MKIADQGTNRRCTVQPGSYFREPECDEASVTAANDAMELLPRAVVITSMKTYCTATAAAILLSSLMIGAFPANAQITLPHRVVSVGGVFGDPSGITVRCPLGMVTALDVGFGPDFFGSPRLQIDYVWQTHAFGSKVIAEYFGPGLAVAFAKGINAFYTREPMKENFALQEDNRFEVGGTAVIGMNIDPMSFPAEFFVETGPLIPFSRTFDLDFDGAVGFRYRL